VKSADFLHEDFARRIPAGDIHLNGMALLDRPGDRTMDATSDGRTRTIATISPTASAIRLTRFCGAPRPTRRESIWRGATRDSLRTHGACQFALLRSRVCNDANLVLLRS
jgi:hypothetical protein